MDGEAAAAPWLVRWIAARGLLVAVAAAVAALAGWWPSPTAAIALLDDPHSTIKALLQCWHVMVLRAGVVPPVVLGTSVAAAALAALPRWPWSMAAPLVVMAAVLAVPWSSSAALSALLLWTLASTAPAAGVDRVRGAARALAWLPGTAALLPLPVAVSVGAAWARRPPARAVVAAVSGAAAALGWFAADAWLARGRYTDALYAWDDDRLDARIRVIERAPPGHHGEYHELELAGDRLLVVAEDSCRLLAVDLETGRVVSQRSLPPRWPPLGAGVLDTFTDPETGITWMLGGNGVLVGAVADGAGWHDRARRVFGGPCNYMYLRDAPEIGRLLLVSVSGHDREPGRVVGARKPAMDDLSSVQLHRADGTPYPSPRDAVWVPAIERLVLAPNFGAHLVTADPADGLVEPWVAVDAANGKLLWEPHLQRLLVAQPGRREIAVIDAEAAAVERTIPTQIGVRTLAVDARRGLLVTASVVTGRVLVQRLGDGERVDALGTVMPMVREMVLDDRRGAAYLSTWTVLYRVDYLGGAGGEGTAGPSAP